MHWEGATRSRKEFEFVRSGSWDDRGIHAIHGDHRYPAV